MGRLKYINHIKGIAEHWRAQTALRGPSGRTWKALISRCHRTAGDSGVKAASSTHSAVGAPGTWHPGRASGGMRGAFSTAPPKSSRNLTTPQALLQRILTAYLSLDGHCHRPHRNQRCPLGVAAAAAGSCRLGTPPPRAPQYEPG